MRAAVAGGAGFIGSHLCEALLAEGHSVVCVDNFVTGRRSNIAKLESNPSFEVVRLDVSEPLPDLGPFDEVYHLASPASPPGYQGLPIETLRVNSEGTRHLLDLAVRSGGRFLYASTSEVYGDPLVHPQPETYRGNVSTTGPRSMYDEAKRFGEAMIAAYVLRGANARIVRIFNTYGPNSDPLDGRLVPNFVSQALRGEPLTIYGDGMQTRSLCYVSDLVRGLQLAMRAEGARGEVINLGNPEEHTILEYAHLVRELTGSASPLVFVEPAVGDDPQRRRPDIARAESILHWRPEVPLRAGLTATIEYFHAELGLRVAEPAA